MEKKREENQKTGCLRKKGTNKPKFIIESDATIVAPLIFAYLLDM